MPILTETDRSPHATLTSLPLTSVTIADQFWRPRLDVNRTESIPYQYAECERTGRIDNFRIAAGQSPLQGEDDGRHRGIYFNDSDVYKWMEAAAYSLATHPDPALDTQLEALIGLVAAAQEDDGYLNAYFTINTDEPRWTDLTRKHELYCGGHMIQAAIAHHRVTGRDSFLLVATKWADLVGTIFGMDARPGAPGHQEVEMALVELYRETGRKEYLELASFFLEQRGQQPPLLEGGTELQDHAPIREQTAPVGHAVRQLYQNAGIADVYAELGDDSLKQVVLAQWDRFVGRRMYITGGAGARKHHEAFGDDYELPNAVAYTETCASIASVMWNWRMLQLDGEARYADLIEQTLYNGALCGVALNGTEYFYSNALEHDGVTPAFGEDEATHNDKGTNRRATKHWDRCACCPPNMARMLASLPAYLYGQRDDVIYVHQYVAGELRCEANGVPVTLRVDTQYPWDGSIRIEVNPASPTDFALHLREPRRWCTEESLSIPSLSAEEQTEATRWHENGVTLRREWQPGDVVEYTMDMPVRLVPGDARVEDNAGKVAIMRGPIVYCLEAVDNPGIDLFDVAIPPDATFDTTFDPNLLGGVTTIRTQGVQQSKGDGAERIDLTLIPYALWANRAPGAMRVWLPTSSGAS